MEATPEKLNLELGDIIQIIAPENDSIHDHIYIIDYIDNDIIRLIDDKDLLNINLDIKDGLLTDETIKAIAILDKSEAKGYIKQNGLSVGQWVEIHFGGDVPTIITANITDIIEDMMELKDYPSNEVIYIDFGYKGIPLHLPINKIHIRDEAPQEFLKQKMLDESEKLEGIPEGDEGKESKESKEDDSKEGELSLEDSLVLNVKQDDIQNKIKEILVEADNFTFGDDVESITQEVAVKDDEKRYAIDVQTNDMLDELLSTVPNIERTDKVLNKINIMINRFKELREQYSVFNERGNIEAIIKKGSDYKPLVEKLYNLNHNLYWLLPVVQNRLKVYDLDLTSENDDIQLVFAGPNLEQMQNIQDGYKNNTLNGSSKYTQLIKSLNPFYTPFTPQLGSDEIIDEVEVNSNINVVVNNIVDNLQEFYTTVLSNDKIKRKRFVINKYNLGLTALKTHIKTGSILDEKDNITRNDKVPLQSLLMLPEQFVRYSHVNLPSTTIYDKTNLNHTSLSYWRFLRNNVSVTNNMVSSLDREMEYDPSTFLKELTHISLNEGLEEDDKYKKFLQVVIPRTRVLFDMVKKYIKKGTNIKDVISYLEPFMIYRSDLSFKQYSEMVEFINTSVMKIKQMNVQNKKDTNMLRSLKQKMKISVPFLINLVKTSQSPLLALYNLPDEKAQEYVFNSEIYKNILLRDYGEFYMNEVSLFDKDLFSNINVEERLNQTIEQLDQTLEVEPKNCQEYVLTKKYISHDELSDDNGTVEVYFDRKYDETPYDIIEEYRSEESVMAPIEFQEFLKGKLVENIGLSEDKAEVDAEAMIRGRRLVRDGQYAVLELFDSDENTSNKTYYKRTGNTWEYDDEITKQSKTEEQKLFCNVRNKCLQLKKDCETIEENKDKIMKENMEKIVSEISDENIQEREKLIRQITSQSKYLENKLQKLIELRRKTLLRDNNKLYRLGLTLEDTEVIISPFADLMNDILGVQDIVKRSKYIIKFVNENTRTPLPNSEESPWWFYCPVTDKKLMPSFFLELANSIILHSGSDYNDVLDKICALRGEISDDGDKWVDKYSGYIIRMRELSTDEGFDDQGFKLVTKALLDEDYIVEPDTEEEKQRDKELNTPEALVSKKIVSALAFYTGINISEHISNIVKESVKITSKEIPSKEIYLKQMERMKAKGKKIPSYERKYNQVLLYFTALYFLITIQTATPGLKTRKTFPGCTKDFTGYPYDESSFGGITYISCVLNKIASSQSPWDSIKGISANTIKKNLVNFYDKFLQKDAHVQKLMQMKREYVIKNGDEPDIPDTVNITKWTTFLPPLKEMKQKSVYNITPAFISEFEKDLKQGKSEQFSKLGVIRGKIIALSMKIIEEIQNVVRSEPALLETMGGEPFLQNVCCNTIDKVNTLNYFIEKKDDIKSNNNKIVELIKIYKDTLSLSNSPFLMSNMYTKVKYPVIADNYTEDIIYKAFIYYCNFTKDFPINDRFKMLCSEKIDLEGEVNIKGQMEVIKSKGIMYTEETLLHLLRLVARENYVQINFEGNLYSSKSSILQLLENINEYDIPMDMELVSNMTDMIKNYDDVKRIHSDKLREVRNYLITNTDLLKKEITAFLTKYSSYAKTTKTKIIKEFNKITQFSNIKDNASLLSVNEMTTIHSSSFIKNMMHDMINVFPSIIMNEVDHDRVAPPKHWKLSQIHNRDIITFMKKNYAQISKLYGNPDIVNLLKTIKNNCLGIDKIINEQLFSSSLNKTDSEHSNLFEYSLSNELVSYLFYFTCKQYLDAEYDIEMDKLESATGETKESEMMEVDILTGDSLKYKQLISDILMTYMEIFTRYKSHINYNREEIMELVLRSKEKEKDTKTRQLKSLTDEERKADAELRKAKLGRWNVGLQKGLTQYVKDMYDNERNEMEKEALVDLELGKLDVVNDMNKQIFAMEFLEQKQSDQDADKEAYDMEQLPEDDDYGDADGDEGFY